MAMLPTHAEMAVTVLMGIIPPSRSWIASIIACTNSYMGPNWISS